MKQFLLSCGLLLAASSLSATTVYVPGEQPTIQAGLAAANPGDTVVVACGIYFEHDILMVPGVTLTGETGDPDCVTIDAASLGRVMMCAGLDQPSTIVGITFTGGLTTGILFPDGSGGGLFCVQSDLILRHCVFIDNEARSGGGVSGDDSPMQLLNCCFENNTATSGGGFSTDHDVTVNGCSFVGNQATVGGAVYCGGFGDPDINYSLFWNNTASSVGGGLYAYFSSPNVAHCTFVENAATCGGGIFVDDMSGIPITNTIIVNSSQGDAINCGDTGLASIECSLISGNAGGDFVGCLGLQEGVDGNFSADPLFCDPGTGDFYLHSDSPCLPENNDCDTLIGALPQGCGESCCQPPTVGNLDGSSDGLVTMGDLTVMISGLLIHIEPFLCIDEANVDMSEDRLITMADLTVLVDNLFISLTPLPPCP